MSATKHNFEKFKINESLFDLLRKLNIRSADLASIENERRYTWVQLATMMGSLELEMFNIYPFIDESDDQISEHDLAQAEDYFETLSHKK